jgi:cardiolipin synthase A/B
VVTKRRQDVEEVVECFEAGWHRHAFAALRSSHLIWCPGPGRGRICQVIDDARHTLFVQNQRLQDMVISSAWFAPPGAA